jgi:hypothetical protein
MQGNTSTLSLPPSRHCLNGEATPTGLHHPPFETSEGRAAKSGSSPGSSPILILILVVVLRVRVSVKGRTLHHGPVFSITELELSLLLLGFSLSALALSLLLLGKLLFGKPSFSTPAQLAELLQAPHTLPRRRWQRLACAALDRLAAALDRLAAAPDHLAQAPDHLAEAASDVAAGHLAAGGSGGSVDVAAGGSGDVGHGGGVVCGKGMGKKGWLHTSDCFCSSLPVCGLSARFCLL